MKKKSVFFIVISFIWAGMLLGISFLEAPVKFTAPSLTLAVGLDVGRHVFAAFNKVEMIFALLLVAVLLTGRSALSVKLLVAGLVVLELLELLWLLPILDKRALLIIAGQTPAESSPHAWYIIFDICKLVLLLVLGERAIRKHGSEN